MPWVAAVVGAAASAYGARQQNRAARNQNRGAGEVDITHQNDPWGPSADYRQDAMAQAQNLFNTREQRWGAGPPGMGGGGGGGGRRRGGGGASASTGRTGQIADALRDRALAGHEL